MRVEPVIFSQNQQLIRHPSPNCGPRRGGARPDTVVLHYTAMASTAMALDRLCDPDYEVSAHYLIARTGEVYQLVNEEQRAWHAGAGSWGAVNEVNSRSIGIELDNDGHQPFGEPLMAALERLLPGVLKRWAIPPERVIGHSDMALSRKIDPGARFDWRRLALRGLSVWPTDRATGGCDPDQFRAALQMFGYCGEGDLQMILNAFRLRFRPGVTGDLDAVDVAHAQDLAARFPVDQSVQSA